MPKAFYFSETCLKLNLPILILETNYLTRLIFEIFKLIELFSKSS